MGARIDRSIYFLLEGDNPETIAKSAGLAVIDFTSAFETLKPDAVFVIADRFECLSIAMAAVYMNIPVIHLEGGEVSGSIDESVRHAITKLSHLHFPANASAARRIERMGEDVNTIYPVGSTSLDVIRQLDLDRLDPLIEIQGSTAAGRVIDYHEPYLVVIQHPVTTEYEHNLRHVNETIQAIADLKIPTVWIWPNIDAGTDAISQGLNAFQNDTKPAHVQFMSSLPIEQFAVLLKHSACFVGNSSCGIRETAFLGVPSVNIGSRQAGRERGQNVMDVDYRSDEIKAAVRRQIAHGHYEADFLYGDGHAGSKIVEILNHFEFDIQKQITY